MGQGKNEVFETLTLILQLGITMLVAIVASTLAAAWIGRRVGISWIAVIGFAVGSAAGMRGCYRLVKKYTKRNDKYHQSIKKAK